MGLTPGLLFLLTTGPRLVLPPVLVHAALLLSRHAHPLRLSPLLLAALSLCTLPLYALLARRCTRAAHTRAARRIGAELVPELHGSLPGNIDLIWKFFFRHDLYIGDNLAEPMEALGSTFGLNIIGDFRVFTAHPQNIKQLLTTEFENYEKGKGFNQFTGSVLGTGVFNSDGAMWQFHRKITRPYFAKERITDFGIFERQARLALDRTEDRLASGQPIDFQDISSRFTIDSACEFLLGTSINSISDPLPEPGHGDSYLDTPSNRFARAFADAQVSLTTRSRLGVLWPLFEIFKDRTSDDMKIVRGFIDPIVRAAMQKPVGSLQIGEEVSLLQHLLHVTDDMKLIVDELVNIMLAARDTTAGLLTFVVYCLAMHPDVLSRLREEVINTVGTVRAPTFEDLRSMKYLRAVVNETLRLFPSVPLNSRFSINSTVLVNDDGKKLFVPPHTRVVYSVLLMQRDETYWGPDAQVFDPDRWLDDRIQKALAANPFVFLPFNAGPRICLGQQFAYHEASFFLVRLLQRFDSIILAPDAQPPHSRPPASWQQCTRGTPRKKIEQFVLKSHLTMYVEGGLWLRMGRAKVTEGV